MAEEVQEVPRIIVVDDDELRRETVCAELRLCGFDPKGVSSEEAVAAATGGRFPLALVDLMLAGTNGFELARSLRAEGGLRVVLTSDYHFTENQLARMDCGAVGFVPRPYAVEELTSFLRAKLSVPPLSNATETT